MLCKAETDGDPSKCLLEGRRVTRCATDLCVPFLPPLLDRIPAAGGDGDGGQEERRRRLWTALA
jgi:hypothetical protein